MEGGRLPGLKVTLNPPGTSWEGGGKTGVISGNFLEQLIFHGNQTFVIDFCLSDCGIKMD